MVKIVTDRLVSGILQGKKTFGGKSNIGQLVETLAS